MVFFEPITIDVDRSSNLAWYFVLLDFFYKQIFSRGLGGLPSFMEVAVRGKEKPDTASVCLLSVTRWKGI